MPEQRRMKLTEWTAEGGAKHLIVLFHWSSGAMLTQELKADGSISLGPRVPMDQLIGGPNCQCREVEGLLALP